MYALNGHPVLSGQQLIRQGWSLNTGSTVSSPKRTAFACGFPRRIFTTAGTSSRHSIACVVANASRILRIGSFSAIASALVGRPVPSWSSISVLVPPGWSTVVDGATTSRILAALLVRLVPPRFYLCPLELRISTRASARFGYTNKQIVKNSQLSTIAYSIKR